MYAKSCTSINIVQNKYLSEEIPELTVYKFVYRYMLTANISKFSFSQKTFLFHGALCR